MTARTTKQTRYDLTQPLAPEEVNELRQWFAGIKPRNRIAEARGLAERTLKAIEDGNSDPHDFEPYSGMGWYSLEIVKRADWLNHPQDEYRKLELAYEIGVLVTEAQLKAAWDADVEKASHNAEVRDRVNRANSKADPEWRAQIVSEIMAKEGLGVTNACREAEFRYPNKGAWTTFRDNYNARKVSDA